MWPFNILNSNPDYTRRSLWDAPKVSYGSLLDVKFVEGSSAPTEFISVSEAKDWMKVDVSDDDTLIGDLITAAREYIEKFLNLSLIQRTVIAIIDNTNGNTFLPYGPVISLTSIQDIDGNDITDYKLQLEDFKRLAWPYLPYIRLEYTAGYSTVPQRLKKGILNQILYMYQHRGDEVYVSRTGSIDVGLSPDAASLLVPFSRNV